MTGQEWGQGMGSRYKKVSVVPDIMVAMPSKDAQPRPHAIVVASPPTHVPCW